MVQKFFQSRPNKSPKIYGYTEPGEEYKGLIKIGYTERDVILRMKEHYPTAGPEGICRYQILFEESSMRDDGTYFKDYEVHRILELAGFQRCGSNNEWFKCTVEDLKAAYISAKDRTTIEIGRYQSFSLRPEQLNAIKKTIDYFQSYKSFEGKIPHFLWNCKMRFGKTFAAYKLAQKMKWNKILILTFKPAVENSWKEDLLFHKDFVNWQFISKSTRSFEEINQQTPFVCFASFQDFLGKNKVGGIKLKNQWAHQLIWDCIIFDEYHYGAWNENSKGILSKEDKLIEQEKDELLREEGNENTQKIWDESLSPLKTNHYLYLSGTPFRALASGEFIEEQIFNWTYTDEQEAKENWEGNNNPYESLPRMVMMTYEMPENITQITDAGEFDQFNLNEFFKAEGEGNSAKFKHEDYVQKWLDLIRGNGFNNMYENLKLGDNKPALPFSDSVLKNILTHTFWFLPSVSSCYAMKNLMMKSSNVFYQDYEIIVCAGLSAGVGLKALQPLRQKMSNPLKTKTITLSCGKLNTGVTVKPWTGLFMLRNTSSPETYFQTAFRVQSPWTIGVDSSPNKYLVLKSNCYLFDFAPNRALRLLSDYSCRLNIGQNKIESKVGEFIKFLPVLCFDGSSMRQINAQEVLDYALVGTSGSQLAKKFESARLINIDDETLKKLMNDQQIVDSLMKIESFRNLNSDLEKIINKSNKIKDLKIKANKNDLTGKEKKEISQEEKDRKSLRKQLQEKLQKFVTRIPVFMYLTEFREETMRDVITKLEPELFKKVTSLTVKDFESLMSIGLFDSTLMNAAIFSFKRYENASLHYGNFTKYDPSEIGLFDTKISAEEFYSYD